MGCGCVDFCQCCFDIFGCPNTPTAGQVKRIKTSPNAESYFVANLGKQIRITGYATIIDGCYTMQACFGDPGPPLPPCQSDNCTGAIFIAPGVFITANTFDDCIECAGLKATDCDNPLNVVIFNGPAATLSIVGLVIKTSFPGFSERCWLISQTTGFPTTSLSIYQGPYQDCPECQGGGCVDLLSTISGIDDTCNRKTGSATVIPLTGVAPFSYLWNNGQTGQTATSLGAGPYSVVFTDSLGCIGTNSIILDNIPCNSYLITPCDPDIAPFVVQNPITSPDPNPNNYVGNIFSGSISLAGTEGIDGCYNMTTSALPGITGVQITVTAYLFNTCIECAPVAYKITRCDDPNIFYFTNSDLSAAVGYTINGVTLTGCDDTTFPCEGLLTQCWTVSTIPPFISPVLVTYDSLLYPDCDCCKPC